MTLQTETQTIAINIYVSKQKGIQRMKFDQLIGC